MVCNDEVLIAFAGFFNPIGLRAFLLIVETAIGVHRHASDIAQTNPAISAMFFLRIVQADIATDRIVLPSGCLDTMSGVAHTGVIGNHIVLVSTITQSTDAISSIPVKGASADNGMANMHTKIESIPSIVSTNVVRPQAVLHRRAWVESVS